MYTVRHIVCAWWAGHPEAWNRTRVRLRDPKTVMEGSTKFRGVNLDGVTG